MKDLFVTYELAVKLEEKGFDMQCLAFYYSKEDLTVFRTGDDIPTKNNSELSVDYHYAAPLWQQAIDWLREEKGIHLVITETKTTSWYVSLRRSGEIESIGTSVRPNYYSALQSGIEKALELLTTNP